MMNKTKHKIMILIGIMLLGAMGVCGLFFQDKIQDFLHNRENLVSESNTQEGYMTFDFGDAQHFVIFVAAEDFWTQFKYGISNQEVTLLDKHLYFTDTENGVYCNVDYTGCSKIPVVFEDGEYKQYEAKKISEDDLSEQFSNWDEVCTESANKTFDMEYGQKSEKVDNGLRAIPAL